MVRFWVWFTFQLLGHFLLLPIKVLIASVARCLWDPEIEFNRSFFRGIDSKPSVQLHKSCDSAKFWGIYAYVSGDNSILATFLQDKDFTRAFCHKNFSGDMLSGWLYGFVRNMPENLMSDFTSATRRSFFEKPYCTMTKSVENPDRGFLFRWWFVFDFLPPLALLYIHNRTAPTLSTKILYYLLLIAGFPLILINPNPAIYRFRLYWISWYSIHSKMLFAWILRDTWIGRHVLRFSYKRYGRINPEITALYCDVFGWTNEGRGFVKTWLDDYGDALVREDYPKREVIDLKHLLKYRRVSKLRISKYLLPSRFRRNEYEWEKPLDRPSYGQPTYIAYYHLKKLYDEGAKHDNDVG